MDYSQAKQYLLSKPDAYEDYPFGPGVAVFKVKDKMFATLVTERIPWNQPGGEKVAAMNLKCDPEQAQALRDIFEAVLPGYHMNKKHWNTVLLNGTVPAGEIERMVDHSYGLVVKSLKASQRKALELEYGAELLYK